MTKEDLEQIRTLMKEEIKPINNRLDKMDERLDKMDERLDKMDERLDKMQEDIEEIKEDGKITRAATNEVVKWIEIHSDNDDPFPVKQKAI